MERREVRYVIVQRESDARYTVDGPRGPVGVAFQILADARKAARRDARDRGCVATFNDPPVAGWIRR